MGRTVTVSASWDDDARVWVATSDDVPGLITEAETCDALAEKLQTLIPELLELNGVTDISEIPFQLLSERKFYTHKGC